MPPNQVGTESATEALIDDVVWAQPDRRRTHVMAAVARLIIEVFRFETQTNRPMVCDEVEIRLRCQLDENENWDRRAYGF